MATSGVRHRGGSHLHDRTHIHRDLCHVPPRMVERNDRAPVLERIGHSIPHRGRIADRRRQYPDAMETTAPHPHDRSRSVNTGRIVIRCAVRSIIAMLLLWCFGAIRFDGPLPRTWNLAIAVLWLAATVVLLLRARTVRDRWLSVAGCISVVIVPWSFKRPSNDRNWAPEYARVASSS